MRPSALVRRDVARAWAGEGGAVTRSVLVGLTPLEWAFRGAVAVKNRWYGRRRAPPMDIPVVSVGNLTVGGSGKTPLLRALGMWFGKRGATAAVITRGYGADEVGLYERWFGADRVFVSPDRRRGVVRAARQGIEVALVDDGFQHRALRRDVDLLLIAAEGPYPARLLPRGPYREPFSSARRASLIVLTRRVASESQEVWRERLAAAAPRVPFVEITLGGTGWVDLDGSPAPAPQGDVVAAAATANPGAFRAVLRELLPGADIGLTSFPDHHRYSTGDVDDLLRQGGDRIIVTTEKDAMKLDRFPNLRGRCRVLQFGVVGPLPDLLTQQLAAVTMGVQSC